MPFITKGNTRLHYQKLGHGPKALLAFHGFGQSSAAFLPITEALQNEYTVYAFDLFHHGPSRLGKKHAPLTKTYLTTLIADFLETEGIRSFAVAGFSMGGKFAFTILESFPERIHTVFLIAADGIKTSFWYSLATYPGWLSGFFKRTVLKPEPLFKLVQVMANLNLMHPSVLRFAASQLEDTPKRLQLYRSWIDFRPLTFELKNIAFLLNKHKIPVTFLFGRYDRIITAEGVKFFTETLENCEVITLKTGHTQLLEAVGRYLKEHPGLKR